MKQKTVEIIRLCLEFTKQMAVLIVQLFTKRTL